jgi:hypothetical protein
MKKKGGVIILDAKLVTENHEIFEWHNEIDDTWLHFDATELNRWALTHLSECECFTCIIDDGLKDHNKKQGIEDWKVERLKEPYLSWPVLSVMMKDGTTQTVDGNHRIARCIRDGIDEVKMIRVPLGKWEWCCVDMPPHIFVGKEKE